MKIYKLKKLPVAGASNFADLSELQKRIENLETVLNLLGVRFAEVEGVLPEEGKELFEEDTHESLDASMTELIDEVASKDPPACSNSGGCGCQDR